MGQGSGLGGGAGSEQGAGHTAGLQEHRLGHTHLPLLIHLGEELIHVCQVFVLKEKPLRTRGPWCAGAAGSQGEPQSLPPMGAVAGPRWPLCLCSSWLNLVGVIQLKNNLPLWGYFYLGLVPSTQTHMWPRATRVPSGNNRHSRRHRCQAGTRGD